MEIIEFIKMPNDPSVLKNKCLGTRRRFNIRNGDWQNRKGWMSYIDDNVVYQRSKMKLIESVDLMDNIRIESITKSHVIRNVIEGGITNCIVIDYPKWKNTRLIESPKFTSECDVSVKMVEKAMKLCGPDTLWKDIISRANALLTLKNIDDIFDWNVDANVKALAQSFPFEDITWIKSIKFGKCPETKSQYFDYIIVEFYMVSFIEDRKGYIKKNKLRYMEVIRKNVERQKRFQNYGIPFEFLRLSRIQITRDNAVLFTFDLNHT